jgi:hypothetical protein
MHSGRQASAAGLLALHDSSEGEISAWRQNLSAESSYFAQRLYELPGVKLVANFFKLFSHRARLCDGLGLVTHILGFHHRRVVYLNHLLHSQNGPPVFDVVALIPTNDSLQTLCKSHNIDFFLLLYFTDCITGAAFDSCREERSVNQPSTSMHSKQPLCPRGYQRVFHHPSPASKPSSSGLPSRVFPLPFFFTPQSLITLSG